MKICMVGSDGVPIPPMHGGAIERHIWELSRNLRKIGVEVHLLTLPSRGASKEEELDGVIVHRGKKSSFLDLLFPYGHPSFDVFAFFKVLDSEFHFDILHIHNGPPGLAVLPSKYIRHKKMVFTEHTPFLNLQPLHAFADAGKLLRLGFILWAEAFLPRFANRVIATSTAVAKGLHGKIGVDKQKICVIPNGVNIENFDPRITGQKVRRLLGLNKNRVILCVGPVGPGKGVHHLVNVMPAVLKMVPDARLLVVGPFGYYSKDRFAKPNDYYFYLKQLSEKLGVSDKLLFTGAVSDDVLPEYYASCDVFSLPSYGEGFGMVLAEANAAGKPVITTPCGGPVDIVRDGYNGFLVPIGDEKALADRIIRLLTDERLARRMGQNGRKLMEQSFTWESIAVKVKRVYEDALTST